MTKTPMSQLPFHFSVGKRSLLLAVLGVVLSFSLVAAPPYHPYKNQNNPTSFRGVIEDLHHEVNNHEEELRMFEERLNTQENILDSLKQQLFDDKLKNQETIKGNSASSEKRMAGVESTISGVMSDIRQLQTHANDSAKTLLQYKNKIDDLEKQMGHLQAAVNSLLDALQLNTTSTQVYEVRLGDSLEKIARRNKTTINKLKELNGLKNDRIYTGQRLKLP
ncbi:MAG: LysM peptidoglycan-binding domain-containing protein [Waddliaceae bacterium]